MQYQPMRLFATCWFLLAAAGIASGQSKKDSPAVGNDTSSKTHPVYLHIALTFQGDEQIMNAGPEP